MTGNSRRAHTNFAASHPNTPGVRISTVKTTHRAGPDPNRPATGHRKTRPQKTKPQKTKPPKIVETTREPSTTQPSRRRSRPAGRARRAARTRTGSARRPAGSGR